MKINNQTDCLRIYARPLSFDLEDVMAAVGIGYAADAENLWAFSQDATLKILESCANEPKKLERIIEAHRDATDLFQRVGSLCMMYTIFCCGAIETEPFLQALKNCLKSQHEIVSGTAYRLLRNCISLDDFTRNALKGSWPEIVNPLLNSENQSELATLIICAMEKGLLQSTDKNDQKIFDKVWDSLTENLKSQIRDPYLGLGIQFLKKTAMEQGFCFQSYKMPLAVEGIVSSNKRKRISGGICALH